LFKPAGEKKGSISPSERDNVWMGAVEKDVLLILYIIGFKLQWGTIGYKTPKYARIYKFKFDLQPGSLTDQVAGEHQPSKKHP